MGALVRATRAELAEEVKGGEFWENTFAEIAGGRTLKEVCEGRGWAYGEVWRTIQGDTKAGGLRESYEVAKKAKAEWVHDGCIPLADESGDYKLRLDERRKSLKVWDREVHGEKMDVQHGGMVPVLVIEVGGGGKAAGMEIDVTPPVVELGEDI